MLSFVLAANEAGYERGLREGLRRADAAAHAEFEGVKAIVHTAAEGDLSPVFSDLGIDPVRDPWSEVGARLEEAREAQRTAVRKSLGGVA